MSPHRMLSRSEVRAVYDRIGGWQDTQVFYESPAIEVLRTHAGFEDATSIFEVGCGTARVAEELLREVCPPETHYVGVDVSPEMVQIARERLAAFGNRVEVVQSEGEFSFDYPSGSQDRILATYVLELLAEEDIQNLLAEAHRLLSPDGRLCVAGLTWGQGILGQIVATLWARVHRIRPQWVGGCHPLNLSQVVPRRDWEIRHREVIRAWGVPSEVLVGVPR